MLAPGLHFTRVSSQEFGDFIFCADRYCSSPRATILIFRSDEVNALRMGFQESNEAHQRTAQRSQAFEKELDMSRRTVETLRVDRASLKEQVK